MQTDKLVEKLYHINWGDGDTVFVFAPSKQEALDKMTEGKGMVNYVVELSVVQAHIRKAERERILKIVEDELDYRAKCNYGLCTSALIKLAIREQALKGEDNAD